MLIIAQTNWSVDFLREADCKPTHIKNRLKSGSYISYFKAAFSLGKIPFKFKKICYILFHLLFCSSSTAIPGGAELRFLADLEVSSVLFQHHYASKRY